MASRKRRDSTSQGGLTRSKWKDFGQAGKGWQSFSRPPPPLTGANVPPQRPMPAWGPAKNWGGEGEGEIFPDRYSPLSAFGSGQDSIRERNLAAIGPRTCSSLVGVIDGPVGKENVVLHAAKQEGGESGHKQELPGRRRGGQRPLGQADGHPVKRRQPG